MSKRSKVQRFEAEEIHRRELKNAPYNPRVLDAKAREKLKRGLENKGLVETLVWNKQTGNLVGGHQRISQIDAIEGNDDYTLTVAVVDVPLGEEKELNILLNNPGTQGDWDLEQLKSIFADDDVNVNETGFDEAELYKIFGNKPTATPSKTLEELNKQLEEAKGQVEDMDRENARRDDEDFYLVVVFKSHDERVAFTDDCGLEDNRYVDGRELDHFIFDSEEKEGETNPQRQGKAPEASPKKKAAKKKTASQQEELIP